jgi:hypothetical protein
MSATSTRSQCGLLDKSDLNEQSLRFCENATGGWGTTRNNRQSSPRLQTVHSREKETCNIGTLPHMILVPTKT